MMTIFKYPLKLQNEQALELPIFCIPLSVQMQGDQLCLWCQVESEDVKEMRAVFIYATGQPIMQKVNMQFVDTVQMGPLVWHVFIEV